MKNQILELAKAQNLYTPENLPKEVLNDPYFAEHLNWYKERYNKHVIPNELKNIKGVEVCVFMEVRQQFKNFTNEHELYYIDHYYTIVLIEGSNTILNLCCINNKYYLYPLYSVVNKLTKNMNYQQRGGYLKDLKEPNKIGVFNYNKLKAWADYCNEYIKALSIGTEAQDNKKAENMQKIQDFMNSLKCKFNKEVWRDRTTIITDFFRVEFELLENGTYLSQKIQYIGGLENVVLISNK